MISILLPNLNTRPYLEERVASIQNQTIDDFEVVVVDGESTDGAWEYLQEVAEADARFRLYSEPPAGIYPAWNDCIERARGDLIYIATSDDNMAPDCLEKLSAALQANPDCGFAHCPVKYFDEDSNEIEGRGNGSEMFRISSGPRSDQLHKRLAPYDGFLHLLGETVYKSITQLMMRRSLIDDVGLFPTDRGSAADFQWVMKAAMVSNSVFVPDTWGGWRLHSAQATDNATLLNPEYLARLEQMLTHVLDDVGAALDEPYGSLARSAQARGWLQDRLLLARLDGRSAAGKVACLLAAALTQPGVVLRYLKRKRSPAGESQRQRLLAWLNEHARNEPLIDL